MEKVNIQTANNNAIILQNAINRMAGNSGLLKGLFLPFVSAIIATQFGLAFSNDVAWFNDWMNRIVFGLLMFFVTIVATIVFMLLDRNYLLLERKLRKLYDIHCVDVEIVINDNGSNQIVDITKELPNINVNKNMGWSIWLYYPIFCLLINAVYVLLVFIIK